VDQDDSLRRFVNKVWNIFVELDSMREIFYKIYKTLCFKIGLPIMPLIGPSKFEIGGIVKQVLFENVTFGEFIVRLQIILDTLWEQPKDIEFANLLGRLLQRALEELPTDLGVRLTFDEQNGYQFYPAGSELLDEKLVDDVLGVLNEEELKGVKIAFTKGLKEFLESVNDKDKLRNCIRDMQLACDEIMKAWFKDKNLGFKHLFKDERWQKVGLNKYQKDIFWSLNEFMDKKIKHEAISEISREDAEFVIYMTGMFIRLVFLKEGE
jgi:hypothetical protein